jgi:tRNA modification GTPase
LNKSDLPENKDAGAVTPREQGIRRVSTSALTGEGIDGLKEAMIDVAVGDGINRIARERMVLNARLVSLLKEAAGRTDTLKVSLKQGKGLEILALEAREILALYEEATGRKYQDNLLDVIFSRFCIGK